MDQEIPKTTLGKFQALEKSQRLYLQENKPVIIRLDGKDVTKNHKDYPLIPWVPFRKAVFDAAEAVASMYARFTGKQVYSAMDEASIIFHDTGPFWKKFDDTNAIYAVAIILQQFLAEYKRHNGPGDTMFGISIFNVSRKDIEEYIALRKQLAFNTAAVYLAKEMGRKDLYHRISDKESFGMMMDDPEYARAFAEISEHDNSFFEGKYEYIFPSIATNSFST